MSTPNAFASFSIFKGNILTEDFMHLVRESDGSVLGWIDENGVPQGTLAQGGGGGGSNIFIEGTPVNNPDFLAGPGVAFAILGSSVTLSNTGVLSLNSLTGTPSVTAGTGISIAVSGSDVVVTNTGALTSVVPWLDIQNYGGVPKPASIVNESTSATTLSGSPDVTLGAAKHFANNMGVCIWKAGAATTQSTPDAPTITNQTVGGSQTLTYKVVGFDAKGGLTEASDAGQVTNAPAIFGSPAAVISSITASTGVVTVNFATPLNNTVVAGMTIHIINVTGSGASWNGIFPIASAPTTQQITYDLAGATGTGTVSSASTGRVSNTQILTALSRNSSGVISGTTSETHNWGVGQIVIIENAYPYDLNGQYPITSVPTGTTFTIATGIYGLTETAQAYGYGTVWEQVLVECPALSGTTLGYYIYSDSPNPGGSLTLIGKTIYEEVYFFDWGPCVGSGFQAPAYVPTSPPASAQNQMFTSTIKSGGGTTSLVLNDNVTTTISSLGATIMYDDGPCLLAAQVAAGVQGVYLSPPDPSVTFSSYVFNSPVTLSTYQQLFVGAGMIVNETMNFASTNSVTTSFGTSYPYTPQFGQRAYSLVTGLASPMFGAAYTFSMEGLGFSLPYGNQMGVVINESYSNVVECAFFAGTNGTSIGLTFSGQCSAIRLNSCYWAGASVFGDTITTGQSPYSPQIPMIWFRASNNADGADVGPGQILFDGLHTGYGRGILHDGTFQSAGTRPNITIGDNIWFQAGTTPAVMFLGGYYNVDVRGIINDTTTAACVAVWGAIENLQIDDCSTSYNNVLTGSPVVALVASGISGAPLGQNGNSINNQWGTSNVGGVATFPPEASTLYQNEPLALGPATPLFVAIPAYQVTASTTSGGSWTAGTYAVSVAYLGWDGGMTSENIGTKITVNGSQAIVISWTAVQGVQGAIVFINGIRQNVSPIAYPTATATLDSAANEGTAPTIDGSGFPLLNENGLIVPEIILASGANKLTAAAPTMTANRVLTLSDAPQSTILSASFTSTSATSDTVTVQGTTGSSHVSYSAGNASAAADIAAGNVSILSVSSNTVVIGHSATVNMVFNLLVTPI